ncbi:small GTP-binding protein domain [Edhazardia aedis USNM 41457]|uniref:Small GTP-binding protein domain n=1 Tax=Edhazardia aedis (strain USNM 41457) TaxID=1003232 RepID=J9D3H8_EDHAE|nr:small GTP-binding protein domain [Edhazardia aedis USNM 41457]|eukprot:EJW02094.1 small GTP-binding protein domain [Edhazardia aedis USNM 41457]
MDRYDFLYKIVLIGDSGVGKTNILLRLSQNVFFSDTKPTIGVEFDAKTFKLSEAVVKAQIWDTAGQERYRAITSAYYRGTRGALLVYDVCKAFTLDNCMQYWLLQLKEHGDPRMVIALVGNKTDQEMYREVSYERGKEIAERNKMLFFETSAKTGVNVENAFKLLMEEIYEIDKEKEIHGMKKDMKSSVLKGKMIKKIKGGKKKGCC